MKRFAAAFVGGLGLGAWLRRRRRAAPAPVAAPADTDALAEELRAKLAQSRVATEEPVAEAAPTPDEQVVEAEPVADEPANLDSRRRDVHDRARQALDELG
jgi:hypothetical protein